MSQVPSTNAFMGVLFAIAGALVMGLNISCLEDDFDWEEEDDDDNYCSDMVLCMAVEQQTGI